MTFINLILTLLAVSLVKCARFISDGQRTKIQLSDNTLNLGKGYSDIQCALRCKLKMKKQFMKDEEGQCFCDDEFKMASHSSGGGISPKKANQTNGIVHQVIAYFKTTINFRGKVLKPGRKTVIFGEKVSTLSSTYISMQACFRDARVPNQHFCGTNFRG